VEVVAIDDQIGPGAWVYGRCGRNYARSAGGCDGT
jgi:hypothetical protein